MSTFKFSGNFHSQREVKVQKAPAALDYLIIHKEELTRERSGVSFAIFMLFIVPQNLKRGQTDAKSLFYWGEGKMGGCRKANLSVFRAKTVG